MKDTNNIFSYNQWAGGEYTENTNGMETNGIIITTKEHSVIGENSFKIINNTNTTRYGGTSGLSATAGKTYTFKATIYNPLTAVNMLIVDSQWNVQSISIPASNVPVVCSVSFPVSQSTTIYCRFNVLSNFAFVDDLSLTVA